MKKSVLKFCLLATAIISMLFFSCATDADSEDNSIKTSIAVNTSSITAGFNSEAEIYAFVTASADMDKTVSWSTSSADIASLSATTGNSVTITTGSMAGSATITVKAGDASKIISVTVKKVEAAVSKITWNASDYSSPSEGENLGIMTAIIGTKAITSSGNGLKFSGGGDSTNCALKFSLA